MSKGAKQALFIVLAAVVIVAVMYTINTGKSTGTVPLSQQGNQSQQQQEQVDPAIVQRIQSLENTVRTGTKDVKVLSELGQLYFDTGQLDKASVAFGAALDIEPDNASLHNYLGLAYFWTGRSKEAIAEYKKATEVDPQAAEAYYNLALALSHSQPSDTPGAIGYWKKVIEIAPDTPLAKKSQEYIDKNTGGSAQTSTAPPLGTPKP